MFTGIVENLGIVKSIQKELLNLQIEISCSFTDELKVDQSISHNGICLTVTEILPSSYKVTAIEETINKTNIKYWLVGDKINLERCLSVNSRFDGHIVQGHVDNIGECTNIEIKEGSWIFTIHYLDSRYITVEKGSITVNGVSLTVVNSQVYSFSVAIIPYTYHHTTFSQIKIGDKVNLEFDIIGKYIKRYFDVSLQNKV